MIKARLKEDFRGDWVPVVALLSQSIEIISESESSSFEFRLFGLDGHLQLKVIGSWHKVRGIVFKLADTEFVRSTLTKGVESTLLLMGWRRSPNGAGITYVYALHGKLRSDFLAGAIIDAVKLIGTDDARQCFELDINGQPVERFNSKQFQPCGSSKTMFRIRD
jgi:hypothetical protein